ncbi:putative Dipeptidyl-peptidase [Blattamonas nauphoetae]|uniref:Dipeptidyl-peptidase n=1 Tax=Blattamonas nauphoetae TaxID=2049346 RepID=A0ABQ9WVM5_9EUKA|nr:putative Dipeptidyl-peptidase [Blattamonas nauphoetae]
MLVFIGLVIASRADNGPFTAEMQVKMNRLGTFVVAPDNSILIYKATVWNQRTNKNVPSWYCVDIENGTEREIFKEIGSTISEIAFSPEPTHVFILQKVRDISKVVLVNLTDETTTVVKELELAANSLKVSKTGNVICFSCWVYPGLSLEETSVFDATKRLEGSDAAVFETMPAHVWDFSKVNKVRHVFYLRADEQSTLAVPKYSAPVDLLPNYFGDCPEYRSGSASDYDISPDGNFVVMSAQPRKIKVYTVARQLILARTDKEAEGANFAVINGEAQGLITSPIFDMSGQKVLFLEGQDKIYVNAEKYLCSVDIVTLEKNVLIKDMGEYSSVAHSTVEPNKIYALRVEQAQANLHQITLLPQGNVDECLTLPQLSNVHSFIQLSHTHFILSLSSFAHPHDLYLFRTDWKEGMTGTKLAALTRLNDATLSTITPPLIPPQVFTVQTPKTGDSIHCWYFPPAGTLKKDGQDKDTKYPLICIFHGGPHLAYQNSWSYSWNPQPYLYQGYAVIIPHYHGSHSFGQPFQDILRGRFGELPMTDVIAARDACLKEFPYLDSRRTIGFGGSCGGYLVDYIAGQQPKENPFNVFLSHASLFDLERIAFETDDVYFQEALMLSRVWDNREEYIKRSPFRQPAAGKWSVPTIITHGIKDKRIPYTQSIALFTELQCIDCPSKLLLFKTEDHQINKPGNSIEWFREVLAFFEKYLAEDELVKTEERKKNVQKEFDAKAMPQKEYMQKEVDEPLKLEL